MMRALPTAALLAASLLCSAGIAELVLRHRFGDPVHFRFPQPRYVADPEIGVWMEPNQSSFNHDEPLEINSVGIRGPTYTREIAPGTRRILALGDSQTFGNGLALEETWPLLLERELERRATQTRWQVLNAGVAGTDSWQHERILARLAREYDFDVAIVGFYVNDVAEASAIHQPERRTNTWSKRIAYLLKRSALATLVWQRIQVLLHPREGVLRERRILTGEPDPAIERGWRQVEASLAAMKARSVASGATLRLVVLPRRDQVDGREPATAYNDRIAKIASRLGIPSADALPALREAYAERGDALFIPWDGHHSALANEIIARTVAEGFE